MEYLATFTIKNQLNVDKYTRPMNPSWVWNPEKKKNMDSKLEEETIFEEEPFFSSSGVFLLNCVASTCHQTLK